MHTSNFENTMEQTTENHNSHRQRALQLAQSVGYHNAFRQMAEETEKDGKSVAVEPHEGMGLE